MIFFLTELQTDIELVLECLNYQKDDAGTVKQSLITLSAILQQNDAAKDIFRECGGLEQVMQLVTSTKCSTVVESGLYCLGSAVAKNGFGQNLIRQSSCLHDILSLVRTLLPKNVRQLAATGFQGGMEESSVDLWSALKLNHIVALGEKAGSRVLCQLLGTVDASITENELSAKRFGQLGGLKTVCQLLSRRPMTDSDKTQAALTLAHAVEACGDNVEQILEGGGMTVLIQQLTKTMDEELSKTIKYLLHLCVPQGESNIGETENHNTDVSSEEALKRRSDMEMLRKIQELDDKLKSLEKGKELDDKLKSLEKGRSECDMALTSPEPMRVGRSRSAVQPTALPPRSKVRITPIRHTALPIRAEESRRENMNNSANGYESDATFKSDFDMSLVRNIRRAPKSKRMVTSRPDPIVKAIGKPSQVIKSQNNTASIDRHVEGRERNVADKWDVSLLSPDLKQPTVPPRPAFSDCGMRRHVLRSPSSVHPHERRSIDDSGIHSPHVFMRRTSPQTSPVDSCPGNMACKGKILNSRTYNIALETDPNTCPFHRKLRQIERLHVHKMKRNKIQQLNLRAKLERQIGVGRGKEYSKESVFNFTSDSTEEVSDDCMSEHRVTQAPCRSQRRRQRLDYTEEEVSNLREGVSVMGKNWNSILTTFNFHPTRTNVDLKDKYKRLMAAEREGTSMGVSTRASRQPKPFSMCEERRLRRGVLKFGYHWKTILTSYTFAKGRSSEDLRNKWRNMHRKK
ncbi:TERB1-like protein [Mya arenaria]|uniref:TERB1-like protein n=1 Tax=Mya arenaria TaxID=6604 RepID=A0ABY7DZR9_MYAAR|nr:TERB1-like protein [Mya arenaria]